MKNNNEIIGVVPDPISGRLVSGVTKRIARKNETPPTKSGVIIFPNHGSSELERFSKETIGTGRNK